MQCYTELMPPSGVTHTLSLPFTAADSRNLLVAKTSLLQVFALKQVNHGHDTKLVLVTEYQLSGTITSLGRVSVLHSKSGGDAVLVALRDAKLSLIEWDPRQYSISTISIHYYENHDLLQCPWAPAIKDCVSKLTVDPSSRCAAFNFGVGNLAIIPFHQLGDDLAMDDYDDVEDDRMDGTTGKQTNGNAAHTTPYTSSFVLPLTVLDTGLLHPIDLVFLHDTREPTLGILYSTSARSSNMLYERKDVTIYAIFALDLEQKASTTLLSTQRLPNDLYRVISLPLPVGGALLIGGNELIHVDQGGKTTGIGVNELARQFSSFSMGDQSHYAMRLEGCQVEQLDSATGDMLMALTTGEIAVLNFRLDGRSVSGLSLQRFPQEYTASIFVGRASCMSALGSGEVFVGSEEGDSVLVGTAKRISQIRRQGSRVKPQNEHFQEDASDGEEAPEDDDDDLYGEVPRQVVNGHTNDEFDGPSANLRALDTLPSIAPVKSVAFGRPVKRKRDNDVDLVLASGEGLAGGVAILSRNLVPTLISQSSDEDVDGLWSFPVKRFKKESQRDENAFDNHIIMSRRHPGDLTESSLYSISNGEFAAKDRTEFDASAGGTVEVGSLRGGNHTVQVLQTEIRVYDFDFGLAQIWPLVDEDSHSDTKAVQAYILDPYVVVLQDDSRILLLRADKSGELDEIDLPTEIAEKEYQCVTLYDDNTNFFDTRRFYTKPQSARSNPLLGLLDVSGHFVLYSLPNIKMQIFSCAGLPFMPNILNTENSIPKHWKSKDSINAVLLASLGDGNDTSPYLIIRTVIGDLTLYQPFPTPNMVGSFQFRKVATQNVAVSMGADQNGSSSALYNHKATLRTLKNVGGFSAVFVLGQSPMIILKSASSIPRLYNVDAVNVKAISAYHDHSCPRGYIYIDGRGQLCKAQLPNDGFIGHSNWTVSRVHLGQDVCSISYFDRTSSYVVAINSVADFKLPQDDEWHPEWQDENISFLPHVKQGSIELLSAKSRRIISSFRFEPAEQVTCVKCLNLEVSEITHERKDLVVVATAIVKGENITARGNLYLFDIVDVVPEPEVPETNLKIKLIAKEEVKGAVTALSGVGSQGFFIAAQGQKCMVRGLKEDLSILPVAFMDMRYYVQVCKELKGTGMTILGDGFSGMWLMGYSEEPYKMQLLGRDLQDLDVQAAEFLPDGKQLYIITSDGDGELHILQYDPENPKSERGTKLLQRSTFRTGSMPTTMTLLPRTPVSSELANLPSDADIDTDSSDDMDIVEPARYARDQILITTQEGGLALITPLTDQTYRRLSTLQNILMTNLEHPCGLNPRAYRAVETDGVGGLGMIDGNLVMRWKDQSSQHKANMADKIGGTVWDIRADLEAVGGAGLGFL